MRNGCTFAFLMSHCMQLLFDDTDWAGVTVTILRANIMLVVAYRQAALELILNVKNKTLSIQIQTRSIRIIHYLAKLLTVTNFCTGSY